MPRDDAPWQDATAAKVRKPRGRPIVPGKSAAERRSRLPQATATRYVDGLPERLYERLWKVLACLDSPDTAREVLDFGYAAVVGANGGPPTIFHDTNAAPGRRKLHDQALAAALDRCGLLPDLHSAAVARVMANPATLEAEFAACLQNKRPWWAREALLKGLDARLWELRYPWALPHPDAEPVKRWQPALETVLQKWRAAFKAAEEAAGAAIPWARRASIHRALTSKIVAELVTIDPSASKGDREKSRENLRGLRGHFRKAFETKGRGGAKAVAARAAIASLANDWRDLTGTRCNAGWFERKDAADAVTQAPFIQFASALLTVGGFKLTAQQIHDLRMAVADDGDADSAS